MSEFFYLLRRQQPGSTRTYTLFPYPTLFRSVHTSGASAVGSVLPNSSRDAWVTDETGFQSANVFSTVGRLSAGTNVLATNVSGKITMKLALFTTAGDGTISPT